MKSGIHVFIFFCCTIYTSNAQNFFKNIEVSLGGAIKNQDRRLFDFPNQLEIINNEDSNLDFEYLANVSKVFFSKRKFNFSSGIGYSLFQTKFSRPFDHGYFSGLRTYDLRYIDKYLQHSIILNINPRIEFFRQNNSTLYVNFNFFVRLLFNKDMKDRFGDWHYNKWLFEISAFESNMGLGYKYKIIGINLAYRFFNIQKVDPAIFSKSLYGVRNPPILEKTNEVRNDNKFWLIVSCQIR